MSFCADDILKLAASTLYDLAADVGIDAVALLQTSLTSGILLKGQDVPVTERRYRGTCSVLFYENTLPDGSSWPFIRFFTFKNGGLERRFNGLRWLKQRKLNPLTGQSTRTQAQRKQTQLLRWRNKQKQEAQKREQRFLRLGHEYEQGITPSIQHPWFVWRLAGAGQQDLIQRTGLRQTHSHRFLLPIQKGNQWVGFQELITNPHASSKKTFTRYEGALKGACCWIAPTNQCGETHPPLICEGFMTGLTLALFWEGPIQVALSANNLAQARSTYSGSVIFAHDQDCWKPQVGNVGLNEALGACQPGDSLLTPSFKPTSWAHQPTDFNDLLMLEGPNSLFECIIRQFEAYP